MDADEVEENEVERLRLAFERCANELYVDGDNKQYDFPGVLRAGSREEDVSLRNFVSKSHDTILSTNNDLLQDRANGSNKC